MDSSDLPHCLLETVELVRALGWDTESPWVGRGVAVSGKIRV